MIFKTKHLLITCLVSFACSLSFSYGEDPNPSSLDFVPANSAVFVHVHYKELTQTRGMIIPAKILHEIKMEADELFMGHLGFQLSEANEFSIVFNDLGSNDRLIGIVGLESIFDPESIPQNDASPWRAKTENRKTIYVHSKNGIALTALDENVIAIGQPNDLNHFLKQDRRKTFQNNDQPASTWKGQVMVGINGAAVSEETAEVFFGMHGIPKPGFGLFKLDFKDGLGLNAKLDFGSQSSAKIAHLNTAQMIEIGKALLADQESTMNAEFRSSLLDFESSAAALGMLGVTRFAINILDEIKLTRDKQSLLANISIEGVDSNMLIISSLAAIQSIGTHAEFRDIAEELNGPIQSDFTEPQNR